MKILYFDFETERTSKTKDLRDVGAAVYAEDALTNWSLFAYGFDENVRVLINPTSWDRAMGGSDDPTLFHATCLYNNDVTSECPAEVREHVESGGIIVAHNIEFDYLIWKGIMVKRYGWPVIRVEQCVDTMAMGYACALPGSLGALGEAVGTEVPKDMEGKSLMMRMTKPNIDGDMVSDPEKLGRLVNYAACDIFPMLEIYKKVPQLFPKEGEVWRLNFKINQCGIYVNSDLIDAVLKADALENELLDEKAQKIGLSSAKIRSAKQLLGWCAQNGENLPNLKKEEVTKFRLHCKSDLVSGALELRDQICRTSIRKFSAMKARACADGRVRGSHVYHRATTGRFAGRDLQVHNIPRPVIKGSQIEEVIKSLLETGVLPAIDNKSPKDILASLIRATLQPAPGKIFYCADFAAIEARVLLWVAGDEDGLTVFRSQKDIYCDMARQLFPELKNHPDKGFPKEARSLGKKVILGLGYGMGGEKFGNTCTADGVDLAGFTPQDVIDVYRKKYYLVKKLWYDTEDCAVSALRNPDMTVKSQISGLKFKHSLKRDSLVCMLPSGRLISWANPELDEEALTPWGTVKPQITFNGVDTSSRWGRQRTYSGKLVENCIQAIARDLLTDAMLRIDAQGFNIVLHVHDEIVVEDAIGANRYDEFLDLMKVVPEWAKGCPIDAEGWQGFYYRK